MDGAITVLVVDDDPMVVDLVGESLAFQGHTVITATGPDEALARVGDDVLEFAVLDLDLNAAIDGVELGNRLIQRYPDLGIIIMTGYQNLAKVVDASRRFAFTYLIKPFQIDQMVALMERINRERALQAENRRLNAALAEKEKEIAALREQLEAAATAGKEEMPVRPRGASLQAIRSYQRQQRSSTPVAESPDDDAT